MAVTQRNSNATMILLFLYRLVEARGRCSIALASAAAALGRLCAARRVGRRSLTPPLFCAAGLQGLLQGAGGGVDPRQFRHYLRADGRDDGLWLPAGATRPRHFPETREVFARWTRGGGHTCGRSVGLTHVPVVRDGPRAHETDSRVSHAETLWPRPTCPATHWLPPTGFRAKDPARVHHAGGAQARGALHPPHQTSATCLAAAPDRRAPLGRWSSRRWL